MLRRRSWTLQDLVEVKPADQLHLDTNSTGVRGVFDISALLLMLWVDQSR